YTVPATIDPKKMTDTLTVRFRVGAVMQDRYVDVYLDDERIIHRRRQIMAPGEMEEVVLKKSQFENHPDLQKIFIKVEEA
ncbi:MAG: pyridine nucleotide-disulfide oxidoreductase, partial [Lachnospiraceae bacterium]|nr:pyridine nucleotide-disulfide oxidoreductase [Lachnospiraceae bacterium]